MKHICECGKEFDTPKALMGHKARVHGKNKGGPTTKGKRRPAKVSAREVTVGEAIAVLELRISVMHETISLLRGLGK